MNLTIHQIVYLALEKLDLRHGGIEVGEFIKSYKSDLTICPNCGQEDFTHLGDCSLLKINENVTPIKNHYNNGNETAAT